MRTPTSPTAYARTLALGQETGVTPGHRLGAALTALLLATVLTVGGLATASPALGATGTYRNPILPESPIGPVESCADPVVIQGQEGETDPETGEALWFMYCTTDPLNDEDRDPNGDLVFHLIPIFSSTNLVDWTYEGDAFLERPDWVADDAGLWAPEIAYLDGEYHLYYGASWTEAEGSAIGVATSDTPTGPFTDSGDPVVDPICCWQWVFDPEIVRVGEETWIFFGSYFGGIRARQLDETYTESLPETQVQITIDNRYEGAEVVFHDGYYYLFVSASNCCAGPLTGYGVFVGRSEDPLGPYVDQEGVSLLDMHVGGTPVIAQNGNRWVGPGHNTVFQDEDGQWWTMYHAVDVTDPYFEDAVGFTKRPAMLDAIDWVDGWPVVSGGPSDTPQQAPAAQEGETTNHKVERQPRERLGTLIWADEFDDGVIDPAWSWVREPNATESGGVLTMDIQDRELYQEFNTASVLLRDLPDGNWVVETKVSLGVPNDPECCYNYAQVGLVVYDSDDAFIKAVEFSNWNTRQVEFAKEIDDAPAGYQRYGNMLGGPAGEPWTWIRIVHYETGRGSVDGPYGGNERYTIWTSHDGETWTRGGTWAHDLGEDAQLGLIAMGLQAPADHTAEFDYVRVYTLRR
jgi:arabinan endo-1,5-alpha-L-arabinosidase